MVRKIFFILLFLPVLSPGQGLEALDKRNGFKDIKLMSSPKSYEGLAIKKEGVDDETFPGSTVYEAKKGHYEQIGSVKIHDLEVYAYKDAIYKIIVISEKDPKLYKGLKKAFGDPEFAYGYEQYYWSADNLKLTYASHSRNKIIMTYLSYRMVEKRKQEKKQAIEDIVDDF